MKPLLYFALTITSLVFVVSCSKNHQKEDVFNPNPAPDVPEFNNQDRRQGGEAGNGGGLAESRFAMAKANLYQTLEEMLKSVQSFSTTRLSQKEIKALRSLADYLKADQNVGELIFVSSSGKPGYQKMDFYIDEALRVARTGSKMGDAVYIDVDQIYPRGVAFPMSTTSQILVHEFGHHISENYTHEFLDALGAKVALHIAQKTTSLEWNNLDIKEKFSANVVQGDRGSTLFLGTNSEIKDITNTIKNSVRCIGELGGTGSPLMIEISNPSVQYRPIRVQLIEEGTHLINYREVRAVGEHKRTKVNHAYWGQTPLNSCIERGFGLPLTFKISYTCPKPTTEGMTESRNIVYSESEYYSVSTCEQREDKRIIKTTPEDWETFLSVGGRENITLQADAILFPYYNRNEDGSHSVDLENLVFGYSKPNPVYKKTR